MRKKQIIIGILLTLIVLVLGLYGYGLYKFNHMESGPYHLTYTIEDEAKYIGVYDNTLYYMNGTHLKAIDVDGTTRFSRPIGVGIGNVIYDKYIYIIENNGLVRALDRQNAQEIRQIKLEGPIVFSEKKDKVIILYHPKGITSLSFDFKSVNTIQMDHRPAKIEGEADHYAVIFLDREIDGLVSRFSIFENDQKVFHLVSDKDLFLFTKKIDNDRFLLATNRYIYLIDQADIIAQEPLMALKAIDVSSNQIALADDDSLKIFDNDLKLTTNQSLDFEPVKLAILDESILLFNEDKLASYQEDNLRTSDLKDYKNFFLNEHGLYLIFDGHVEKVKSN